MNKSFRDRLAALEALETHVELDHAPLTWEDRELLFIQIALYNVTVDDSGRVVRSWRTGSADVTADLDRAISRCNAALAALVPRLRTLEAVDAWIRDLDDPATFDDDTIIAWTHWGLTKTPDHDSVISFTSGELRVSVSFRGGVRGYWERIVERAGPLLKARGIVLVPLLPEDARAALALLDAGVLRCHPITGLHPWRSHHTTIQLPYNSGISNETHGVRDRLVWAFDQVQYQTGGAFIETAEELRAVLIAGLEKAAYESVYETIDRPRID
jgi:hypothetical protein